MCSFRPGRAIAGLTRQWRSPNAIKVPASAYRSPVSVVMPTLRGGEGFHYNEGTARYFRLPQVRRARLASGRGKTMCPEDRVAHFLRRSSAIAALALLSALPGCGEENKYEPPPAPKVGVAQPAKQLVTRYLDLTGNTVTLDKVELVARVVGFLREINYKDGTMVKKGDVLFVIEPAPYEAKVQEAEAEVAAAKATVDFAEAEFQRQDALSRTTQFGWQSKLYEAQKNRDESRAHLQKAQASLELAKIELGYTNITAPFDGIVTTHLAAVGALVGGGNPTPLATILRLDPIYVKANLSEQDVLRIIADPKGISTADLGKIPIELGLMTETGYPHKGVIDYIAPLVDPSTGTLELRGDVCQPRLWAAARPVCACAGAAVAGPGAGSAAGAADRARQ